MKLEWERKFKKLAKDWQSWPKVTAKSWAIVNMDTGKLLFGQNVRKKKQIAS